MRHPERNGAAELQLVIDTDTAADDAIALTMAAVSPVAQVHAVTTVAGNMPLEITTRNALDVLALCGQDAIPVYAGAARPLVRDLSTAEDVHGEGGLSGVRLPRAPRGAQTRPAPTALVEMANSAPGALTLVTLGPLTNVANALALDPALLSRFRSVVCMAGSSDYGGNITATAEYNAWADPEAMAAVLRAAHTADVSLVGWDVSRDSAVIGPEDRDWLESHGGPLGAFANDICAAIGRYASSVTGLDGYDLADPIAMAVALSPSIVTASRAAHVDVALDPILRGQLIIDDRRVAAPANVRLVTGADADAFKRLLFGLLASTSVDYRRGTQAVSA